MTAAERMWKIRDAVLAYLYEQYTEDEIVHSVEADKLSAAVGWTDSPIENAEVGKALSYLMQKGYVKGIEAFGGDVLRPTVTSDGQDFVARGLSVKGPAEGPQAVPSSIVINATGNTNLTIGSQHVTQSITSGDVAIEKARGVADALEKAAAEEGVSGAAATEARNLATEIRAAADADEPDAGGLRALMGRAISTAVAMANNVAGSKVAQLAIEAAPLFL